MAPLCQPWLPKPGRMVLVFKISISSHVDDGKGFYISVSVE